MTIGPSSSLISPHLSSVSSFSPERHNASLPIGPAPLHGHPSVLSAAGTRLGDARYRLQLAGTVCSRVSRAHPLYREPCANPRRYPCGTRWGPTNSTCVTSWAIHDVWSEKQVHLTSRTYINSIPHSHALSSLFSSLSSSPLLAPSSSSLTVYFPRPETIGHAVAFYPSNVIPTTRRACDARH